LTFVQSNHLQNYITVLNVLRQILAKAKMGVSLINFLLTDFNFAMA